MDAGVVLLDSKLAHTAGTDRGGCVGDLALAPRKLRGPFLLAALGLE